MTYLVALRNGERAFEKSLREVVLLNSMDTYQCKRGLINCPHIIVIIGINIVSKKLGHEMREFFGVKWFLALSDIYRKRGKWKEPSTIKFRKFYCIQLQPESMEAFIQLSDYTNKSCFIQFRIYFCCIFITYIIIITPAFDVNTRF